MLGTWNKLNAAAEPLGVLRDTPSTCWGYYHWMESSWDSRTDRQRLSPEDNGTPGARRLPTPHRYHQPLSISLRHRSLFQQSRRSPLLLHTSETPVEYIGRKRAFGIIIQERHRPDCKEYHGGVERVDTENNDPNPLQLITTFPFVIHRDLSHATPSELSHFWMRKMK